MKNSKVLKTVLFLAGLIAAGIGGTILLMPSAFYATYGIDLGENISLLNEVRAPGGALLAAGILIISGSFVVSMTFTSTVVAALFYLSYGISRILSFAMDGMPSEGLVQAAALEIFIGLVCVFVLSKDRVRQTRSE
jgi:hypothetical protein